MLGFDARHARFGCVRGSHAGATGPAEPWREHSRIDVRIEPRVKIAFKRPFLVWVLDGVTAGPVYKSGFVDARLHAAKACSREPLAKTTNRGAECALHSPPSSAHIAPVSSDRPRASRRRSSVGPTTAVYSGVLRRCSCLGMKRPGPGSESFIEASRDG